MHQGRHHRDDKQRQNHRHHQDGDENGQGVLLFPRDCLKRPFLQEPHHRVDEIRQDQADDDGGEQAEKGTDPARDGPQVFQQHIKSDGYAQGKRVGGPAPFHQAAKLVHL